MLSGCCATSEVAAKTMRERITRILAMNRTWRIGAAPWHLSYCATSVEVGLRSGHRGDLDDRCIGAEGPLHSLGEDPAVLPLKGFGEGGKKGRRFLLVTAWIV